VRFRGSSSFRRKFHFGIIIPKRRFHEEKWVAYRSRPRFDPHLSRSVQESLSVAYRARPREDCCARPATNRQLTRRANARTSLKIGIKAGFYPLSRKKAKEDLLSKDAWRRWSATAEDYLPTTVGQGWSYPVAHAYRALDPQFPQRFQA